MGLVCITILVVLPVVEYLLGKAKLADRIPPTLRRGALVVWLIAVIAAVAEWRLWDLEQPRRLTPTQQQALVEAVRAFTPERNTIRMTWPIEDEEAKSYAAQFERTFRRAGWPAMSNPFQSNASLVFTGVRVSVPTGSPKKEIAESILAALLRSNVPHVTRDPYREWTNLEIKVGSKVSR